MLAVEAEDDAAWFSALLFYHKEFEVEVVACFYQLDSSLFDVYQGFVD